MANRCFKIFLITVVEISIFWGNEHFVLCHDRHGSHLPERPSLGNNIVSNSRFMQRTDISKREEIIITNERPSASTRFRIPLKILKESYYRSRRHLKFEHQLRKKEVALSLTSFHHSAVRFRVLYVYGDVVAGRPMRDLERRHRLKKIGFRVTTLPNGNRALKVIGNTSDTIHRYVVADGQNEGLRICEAASAGACEEIVNGRTIRTPALRFHHFTPGPGVLLPYQWGLAFQFGSTEKFLKVMDATGQTTFSNTENESTKFNIFFNGE